MQFHVQTASAEKTSVRRQTIGISRKGHDEEQKGDAEDTTETGIETKRKRKEEDAQSENENNRKEGEISTSDGSYAARQ